MATEHLLERFATMLGLTTLPTVRTRYHYRVLKGVEMHITLDPAGRVTLFVPALHSVGAVMEGIGACTITAGNDAEGDLYTATWEEYDITVQGRDFHDLYMAHVRDHELALVSAPYLVVLVGLAAVTQADAFPYLLVRTEVLN